MSSTIEKLYKQLQNIEAAQRFMKDTPLLSPSQRKRALDALKELHACARRRLTTETHEQAERIAESSAGYIYRVACVQSSMGCSFTTAANDPCGMDSFTSEYGSGEGFGQ